MSVLYVAIDGDDVGRRLEGLVVRGEVDELRRFSRGVDGDLDTLANILESIAFDSFVKGGDTILACGPAHDPAWFARHLTTVTITISVGLGRSLTEAFLGLKIAKASGKNQIVYYQTEVNEEDGAPNRLEAEYRGRWTRHEFSGRPIEDTLDRH
jgi:minimal CRISPR polymerase domain